MDNQNQPKIFTDYTLEQSSTHSVSKSFFANVFLWMFGALAVSTIFAYLFASDPALLSYLITPRGGLSSIGLVVLIAPLGLVLMMRFGIERMSAPIMILCFLAFAVVMGISFSFILLKYTSGSIISCFAAASVMFGIMAVMGYTTNKDLTSFGHIMKMGLVGIVVAMLINLFMHSGPLNYLISIIGVAVFTGLTAYDVQKLKRISVGLEYEGVGTANVRKLSILGALTLYLDFINLFLMLLRLFGNRR